VREPFYSQIEKKLAHDAKIFQMQGILFKSNVKKVAEYAATEASIM